MTLCSAANWLTFLLERAPPAVFLLLATGPCLSGLHMVQGYVDWERAGWAVGGMLVSGEGCEGVLESAWSDAVRVWGMLVSGEGCGGMLVSGEGVE